MKANICLHITERGGGFAEPPRRRRQQLKATNFKISGVGVKPRAPRMWSEEGLYEYTHELLCLSKGGFGVGGAEGRGDEPSVLGRTVSRVAGFDLGNFPGLQKADCSDCTLPPNHLGSPGTWCLTKGWQIRDSQLLGFASTHSFVKSYNLFIL